ncbi:MAG: hypothetical protein H6718_29600 [Polyangiaceae bacterium]|nr:hypothetical protein [Polyangiaceae bacterium]
MEPAELPRSFLAQRSRLRQAPLEPLAVMASGPTVAVLLEQLLTWPEQSQTGERCLADLRAARTADTLFLLGETRSLPWVDGVRYLGRDVEAPDLLLPTDAEPALPLAWFRAALARGAATHAGAEPPFAICFAPPRIVSLAAARALCREDLLHWRAELERSHDAP